MDPEQFIYHSTTATVSVLSYIILVEKRDKLIMGLKFIKGCVKHCFNNMFPRSDWKINHDKKFIFLELLNNSGTKTILLPRGDMDWVFNSDKIKIKYDGKEHELLSGQRFDVEHPHDLTIINKETNEEKVLKSRAFSDIADEIGEFIENSY